MNWKNCLNLKIKSHVHKDMRCVNDSCPLRINVARIEGLESFSIRAFKHEHKCSEV